VAQLVQEFKNLRHLMVQDFYQLLPTPATSEEWDAVQFTDYAGSEAAVFAFSGSVPGAHTLRLQGLAAGSQYVVTKCPNGPSVRMAGSDLMSQGLDTTLGAYAAALWHVSPALRSEPSIQWCFPDFQQEVWRAEFWTLSPRL
jgi:hypothetical protein